MCCPEVRVRKEGSRVQDYRGLRPDSVVCQSEGEDVQEMGTGLLAHIHKPFRLPDVPRAGRSLFPGPVPGECGSVLGITASHSSLSPRSGPQVANHGSGVAFPFQHPPCPPDRLPGFGRGLGGGTVNNQGPEPEDWGQKPQFQRT